MTIEAEAETEALTSIGSGSTSWGDGGNAETSTETETNDDDQTQVEAEGEGDEGGEKTEETETEGEASDEEQAELEDWEEDGKTYKVHKDLKPKLMLQADYTRKTQEVAETKRALEAREQSFRQQATTHNAMIKELAQLQTLDEQLAKVQSATPEDWAKLEAEDPLAPQRVLVRYEQLKAQRESLVQGLQAKHTELTQAQQRETAKLSEDFARDIQREFKDWSPELNLQLTNHARAVGFTDQELSEIRDVRYLKVLREAMEGRALKAKIAKQTADAKAKIKKDVAKPLTKPASGVKAPARTGGPLDDQPIEVWMKMRDKQVAARGR